MSDKNIKGESKVWSIRLACEQLVQCVCDSIVAIHTLLGCDTTSRVFLLVKVKHLQNFKEMNVFSKIYTYSSKKIFQKDKLKKQEKDY